MAAHGRQAAPPTPAGCSRSRAICAASTITTLWSSSFAREVSARFGLTNAWLYVFEREDDEHAVLVAAAGPKAEAIRERAAHRPDRGRLAGRGAAPRRGPDRHPGRAGASRETPRWRSGWATGRSSTCRSASSIMRWASSAAARSTTRARWRSTPRRCRTSSSWGTWPRSRSRGWCCGRATSRASRCRLSSRSASGWRAWACWPAASRTTSTTC